MTWELSVNALPGHLSHISNPPRQLFVRARDSTVLAALMDRPKVAIVGTRMVTAYGQEVTIKLAQELAARGVVIISGLALGVDGIAHRAALEVGGLTVAVLPTPVEQVYPRSHHNLAKQILENDGALISEYPADAPMYKTNFIARNRIVAGLADALLITEAAEHSGTMHTAGFALEQGITVLTVPGNITSPTSAGTNNLIKAGATPVTSTNDILNSIGIATLAEAQATNRRVHGSNKQEQQLIDLMEQGITDGNKLLDLSSLATEQFNHHMTMLELTAKIRAMGANQWCLT
jgi:DNA processing protein